MFLDQLSDGLHQIPAWYLLNLVGLLIAVYLGINRYGGGLNHIPGPALAPFSNLWRFLVVWGRRPELEHIRLHEKYGPLVRLGPRVVSVADPAAISVIYALNAGFVKSGFYPVQQTIAKGRRLYTMFSTTDEKFHAKLRRAVSNAYAMSTLVQFEPLVDSTTLAFLDQLEKRFADRVGPDGVCDFSTWLQFYAFDVIGELTFSKRLGFVERGEDVDGIIKNLEWLLNYAAIVGQLPFLDRIFLKNPVRLFASQIGLISSSTPVATFARNRVAARQDVEQGEEKPGSSPGSKPGRRDFLSRFTEAHHKDREFISRERVLALTVANMFAGSDTTAISLRAIFYYLLRNPEDMENLMKELEQIKDDSANADGMFNWNSVKDLPYLSAVVKEGLRCHPAAGLTLERIVPPQGITICGRFIPGGTIVGCSAWTVHRSPLFGAHPEQFRPKRWIEASTEQKRLMENSLFTFGAGSHTCIGRNISYLEMYKLVPALLTRFEVGFADPSKPWKLHNAWFVKQSEFNVRLRRKQ
ncbi:hypothetical protein H2200_011010 [Cladophialophora chaetospira]|uniref:Pisatin demethylase n=1 Tax=Cladophialophora chaetospira TaxID=386627 RepID=A0AA39CDE1_9EURO|nr:hypothetical protein H2200_011010 [Cladophialophora chaetospira]